VRIAQPPVGYYFPGPSIVFSSIPLAHRLWRRWPHIIPFSSFLFDSILFSLFRFYSAYASGLVSLYKSSVRLLGSLKLDLVSNLTCLCLRTLGVISSLKKPFRSCLERPADTKLGVVSIDNSVYAPVDAWHIWSDLISESLLSLACKRLALKLGSCISFATQSTRQLTRDISQASF
jgi:hypothetical protein